VFKGRRVRSMRSISCFASSPEAFFAFFAGLSLCKPAFSCSSASFFVCPSGKSQPMQKAQGLFNFETRRVAAEHVACDIRFGQPLSSRHLERRKDFVCVLIARARTEYPDCRLFAVTPESHCCVMMLRPDDL